MTTSEIIEPTPVLTTVAESRSRSQSPIRRARHTKGLSLNFPILLPTQYPSTTNSPATASPPDVSANPSPKLNAELLPPTQETTISASRTSADFLTLVAAQERKVLELREELNKADAELTTLKKQWAIFEANKKREEVRQVRRLPVSLDQVPSPNPSEQKDKEERQRRRALVEMSNNTSGGTDTSKLGRRGSKRVFEGRHTRTLSLLSPTTKSVHVQSIDTLVEPDNSQKIDESPPETHQNSPSLSRMPTLDGLVSPESLQSGLGKTYKQLAAHRRSLPPGTADFMKQGKQVVDGVREGLWTFFEDIRQATVGDEAINGPTAQHKTRQRHRSRSARPKSKSPRTALKLQNQESFWTEFGLDTPQKTKQIETDLRNGHVQQKSSTDSQNPPDLLEDTNGDDHEDDWDNWESPTATRTDGKTDIVPLDSDGLPWPELKKLTHSKLTRTASDLMREWHDGDEPTVNDEATVTSIR